MGNLPTAAEARQQGAYLMGFQFTSYTGCRSRQRFQLSTMSGSDYGAATLFPDGIVAPRTTQAAKLPPGERAASDAATTTLRAVDRRVPS
jgi:hypothetical protein